MKKLLLWLKGWRTVILGTLVTALGFVQDNIELLTIPPEHRGKALMAIGLAVIVLRAVTTGPIGGRKQ